MTGIKMITTKMLNHVSSNHQHEVKNSQDQISIHIKSWAMMPFFLAATLSEISYVIWSIKIFCPMYFLICKHISNIHLSVIGYPINLIIKLWRVESLRACRIFAGFFNTAQPKKHFNRVAELVGWALDHFWFFGQ